MAKKKVVKRVAPSKTLKGVGGLPKVSISRDSLQTKKKELWQTFICLYGIKGIGKTTLASSFPNFMGIQAEPERDELDEEVYQVHVPPYTLKELLEGRITADGVETVEYSSWDYIKAYLIDAEADPNIQGVFIDTIDLVYQYCYDHVCWKANVDSAKELGFGDGWTRIAQEFSSVFTRFNYSGKGVVFLSHTKDKEKAELTIDKQGDVDLDNLYTISAGKQAFTFVQRACQYVFFYGLMNNRRTLLLRRNPKGGGVFLSCGGLNKFQYTDGTPIYQLDMQDVDPYQGYTVLEAAFNNEIEPEVVEEKPKLTKKKVFKKK